VDSLLSEDGPLGAGLHHVVADWNRCTTASNIFRRSLLRSSGCLTRIRLTGCAFRAIRPATPPKASSDSVGWVKSELSILAKLGASEPPLFKRVALTSENA
jgi:hypothetical protein